MSWISENINNIMPIFICYEYRHYISIGNLKSKLRLL